MQIPRLTVYSSTQQLQTLFQNKESTTIFIKLEARWVGKREESTFTNKLSS